ncbi:MAG TPA: ATP-binding protein [Gemmatimonadales bacterium]|jgi:PAS domain S-box-containing protein|nr:ATP-binding protein [Gemmatimonadales bacterium]
MDGRAVLESLDVGVVVIAPDWTIVEWTPAAARIVGITADRVLGKGFWVAFPTTKGTSVERILQGVLFDGQPQTYVLPARAPEFRGMVFETRVTRGPRNHLILVLRDMRSDLSAESHAAHILTAFEQERRFYRQLFDALPSPALVLSVDGQILESNPQATELLGAAAADALRGRPIADWIPASMRPAFATSLRDAMRQRQQCRLPLEVGDESTREVEAVIENVDPAQPQGVPKLLFLAVDVSREVLLQRKLLQADRLSQLGALVSGVAHELNNPLAAIAAFAEVLAVDAKTPELKESAGIIHLEAMRAGRIIQTLLDFARQRAQVRQPVDLKEIGERVLALQRSALKKARVQATLTIGDDVPAVLGDPQELQQVLLNAVVNSVQAIEAAQRSGRITIAAQGMDGHVVLSVEDTGPGVPAEIQDRVFEPFFTTKGDQGTGLGLSISFGIVKAMGGRMWIQNIDGSGARLVMELPAEVAAPRPTPQPGVPAAARPLSVLIIEDEESVRRAMIRMAERLGHRVTSAGRFNDAVGRLHDTAARYDALVVDVHLDEAHTGFDLFEELLQEGRGRERRVVFTTGDSISTQTRDRLQRSERPVLRKPFNLEELREMLDRVGGVEAEPS